MHRYSRYRFCEIHTHASGRRFLGERPKFLYRDLPDNRLHTVKAGDRLWHLAQLNYGSLPRAGNLWWAIADFQPEPILDATIEITRPVLVIPSTRTVVELILSNARERAA